MSEQSARFPDELGFGVAPDLVMRVLAICSEDPSQAVFAVPALRHLRATYPGAHITVVVAPAAVDLLDRCPYVDRVLNLEQPNEALIEHFDVAISWAKPASVSSLGVDSVSASFRASWREAGVARRRAIHPTWPVRMDAASRMLRLAWLLGGDIGNTDSVGLWTSLADRNLSAQVVESLARPIAVVHAGHLDGSDSEHEAALWASISTTLCACGLDIAYVGNDCDSNRSVNVSRRLDIRSVNVVGRSHAGLVCGLLERAVIFVGTKGISAALAGVLEVPSVLLGGDLGFEYHAKLGCVDVIDPDQVPMDGVLSRVQTMAFAGLKRNNYTKIS